MILALPFSAAIARDRTIALDQFLRAVKTESPDLAVESANVEAADARATGIRISPPMVGYMQMKEGGATQKGYEVLQEIPFPTKIFQDKRVRNREFDAQKENSEYQKHAILANARVAFLSFWSAYERLQIAKEKHDWLKGHLKLSRTATRSDTEAQIHLLEIESEADTQENEVLSLEAELAEKRAALRTFAPSLPMADMIPADPPLAKWKPSGRSAFLSAKEQDLKAKDALVGLKKNAYLPDIFVRYQTLEANSSMPRNQELMVGISLPFLFFWQPRAEVAEASAARMRAEGELQKAQIEYDSKLMSLTKKADAIRAQLGNLREKILPRAERRVKFVKNLSQRTMEGLDEHRSTVLGYLDLRVKAVELRESYEDVMRELLTIGGAQTKEGAQ